MKRVLAIAGLAVKAAVRSRLFLVLSAILLLVVVGLPASVKGDGTLQGRIALVIYYSLGLSTMVLGTSTVWISCWSISREVEEKHIQMLVVKPVHRFQVWLGKWLGILFVNALLLTLAALVTYRAVGHMISSPENRQEEVDVVSSEILTCRRTLAPEAEDLNAAAHEYLHEQIERGEVASDAPHDIAFENAYKVITASRATVPPGSSKSWTVSLDGKVRAGSDVSVRYHLTRHARYRNPVSGKWIVRTAEDAEPFVYNMENYLSGRYAFDLPAEILAGSDSALVTFENADRTESNVAMFDVDSNLEILVGESSFGANYSRAVIILFCHLALLAALGLTAGSLFTFPVASFITISVLVMSILSHYFSVTYSTEPAHHCHNHDHAPEKESAVKLTMEKAVVQFNVIVAPAMHYQPLASLIDGLLVSKKDTAGAVGVLLLLYPGLFGILAAIVLNKRELAL